MSIEPYIKSTILTQYTLPSVIGISPITTGWVNKNFRIYTTNGDFVLQRLAPVFDNRTIEDMAKVTAHLRAKGIASPELVATHEGAWFFRDENSDVWKLMHALDGETFTELTSDVYAFEAGKALGEFIAGLEDFDTNALQNPLQLHQTEEVYKKFLDVFTELIEQEKQAELKEAYEYIRTRLPEFYLPEDLPRIIVHGDPKISNILFSNGKAHCMIDIDTCMQHTPLVDIGDAMWSWCGIAEDHPKNVFSLERFAAAMRGFLSIKSLSQQEQEYIHTALLLIPVELASRFARDIIDDSYFGWEPDRYPSRRAHNKARVKSLVHLAQDIEQKKSDISRIIHSLA